jgi:autotransporter-associated beta strand protein
VISGTGALMQKSSTTYLNGANTYSGGTTPAAGAIGLGCDSVSSSPPTVDSGPIGTGPLLLINDSTTSLTGGSERPEIWTVPSMDFTMFHSYNQAQPAPGLAQVAHSFVSRYGKPVMIGEFGTDWRGWYAQNDPFLRGWRQGIWGGALGGAACIVSALDFRIGADDCFVAYPEVGWVSR